MQMFFKEKKSAKATATIFLRLLDSGKYYPLLRVTDLDGQDLLCKDLPETIDLNIIGEIQLSTKKVTIKPRKNAFTMNLKPNLLQQTMFMLLVKICLFCRYY